MLALLGNLTLWGLVGAVDVFSFTVVALLLGSPTPVRLLAAYAGGLFAGCMTIGLLALFVLKDAGVGDHSLLPPAIEAAIGVFLLVIALAVATRFDQRHLQRWQPSSDRPRADRALSSRLTRVLGSGSPALVAAGAFVYGLPSPYALGAVAMVLEAGVARSLQVVTLTYYVLLSCLVPIVALFASFRFPEATARAVAGTRAWITSHTRTLAPLAGGAVGVYLVLSGLERL